MTKPANNPRVRGHPDQQPALLLNALQTLRFLDQAVTSLQSCIQRHQFLIARVFFDRTATRV